MSELVIASSEADARAAEAVTQHHAALAGALSLRAEALLTVASRGDASSAEQARRDLVEWCERELVPHALAEEQAMYPAAQATVEGRLLVEAMLGEHEVLTGLVREVAGAADTARAAASAAALRAVFDSHLTKENTLVVPLLASIPGVSLSALLGDMHELLGDASATHDTETADAGTAEASTGFGGHTCSCGEVDSPGYPELDVRSVPHSIRHATVFGALESLRPGAGLELVAPHDPLPLLDQVNRRWPGRFSVTYSERGPEAWRLSLTSTGA
jgi:uncharacterized protein (DUF2249 family)